MIRGVPCTGCVGRVGCEGTRATFRLSRSVREDNNAVSMNGSDEAKGGHIVGLNLAMAVDVSRVEQPGRLESPHQTLLRAAPWRITIQRIRQ